MQQNHRPKTSPVFAKATHPARSRQPSVAMLAALTLAICLPAAARAAKSDDDTASSHRAADFYNATAVRTVHIHFTAEEWKAMEPASGGGPGGGAPGGSRPGGPGFDPAAMIGMLFAPVFVKEGDQNADGKLSRDEFHALGVKWFAAWDKQKAGSVNADQVRDGLNALFVPPAMGQPGGGPGGGGPGGGGPAGGQGGGGQAGGGPQNGPGGGGPPRMALQGPEGKRNGLSAMMGIEFKYVHADVELEGETFKDAAVRYKGNGTYLESRGSLKRSLKIELNHFVKGQKYGTISTIDLQSNVTDASFMNEVLSYRLFRDAGVPAPRSTYARVYVTVPGIHEHKYFGLYSVVENVDKAFAKDRFAAKGGAMLKPVTPNLFGDLGDDWKTYNQTYDPKTTLTDEQKRRIIELCKFASHSDDATFASKLGDYIDLENLARYMAVTVYLTDLDSILGPGQNMYLFLDPKSNKIEFIPWDQDHSFGQFKYTQEQREKLSIHRPWEGENHFLDRLFKVEAFMKLYLARLDEFNRGVFKPERFHQQVDEIAAAIRPAAVEESAQKAAALDRAAAGEPPAARGIFGFGGGGAKPIKGFVDPRSASLIEQVAGRSQGMTLVNQGFGGGPGPGNGPPQGGPGGDRGPGGQQGPPRAQMGPGNFLASGFVAALDADKDAKITQKEFIDGFDKWFTAWDTGKSGVLTEEQLRTGIGRELAPRPGAFPGAPGGGGNRGGSGGGG